MADMHSKSPHSTAYLSPTIPPVPSLTKLCVDAWSSPTAYQIDVELPGFKSDQIQVSVDSDLYTFSITATRQKSLLELLGNRYDLHERPLGVVNRSIPIPHTVDVFSHTVTFEDGVLSVSFPKLTFN
jgi:HSP20 family protein